MTASIRAALSALLILALPGFAAAQAVDQWQFRELRKQVEDLSEEVARTRNALAGGNIQQRLNALEDEISRLTGQIERLEHAVRTHNDNAKKKLEDLEYRIIELEGGDPSILFQNDGSSDQGSLAPSGGTSVAAAPSGGQSLGVLTTPATPGGGDFQSGVAAAQAGRYGEAISVLGAFVSANPDSPLAGDANYWMGESYFAQGQYQNAANRYLDAASLYPTSAKAPESLVRLGVSLNLMGKRDVACSTFREVRVQYPGTTAEGMAASEAQRAGCG